MPSLLRMLAWVGLIAVATVALVWHLAFRVGRDLPGEVRVAGLGSPAEITWIDGLDADVKMQRAQDLPRVAGVVQALSRPWTLLVLRQAALGRLSEWYGEPTADLDTHVRLVGIPQLARSRFEALDEPERGLYAAFASGVNATLRSDRVAYAPGLSVLGVEPEPWLPWHSMAVEGLVSWLSASVVEDSLAMARLQAGAAAARDTVVARILADRLLELTRLDSVVEASPFDFGASFRRDSLAALGDSLSAEAPDYPQPADITAFTRRKPIRRFLDHRDRLGDFLALTGLEHSAAWVTGSTPEGIFVRFVWGSAAEPPVVALHATIGSGSVDLITWLGSPAPLAWRDTKEAVVSVPGSVLTLGAGDPGSRRSWESVRIRDVGTAVVERRGDAGRLLLGEPGDSLLVTWTGWAEDRGPAWTTPWGPARPLGENVIRADGLTSARFSGHEPTLETGVAVVSLAPERFELAKSLSAVRSDPLRLLDDTRSDWAARRLALLLRSLDLPVDSAGSAVETRDSAAAAELRPDSLQQDSLEMGGIYAEPGGLPGDSAQTKPREVFLPLFAFPPGWAAPDSDAVEYLRNWNGSYDASSIAATIFEPLSAEDTLDTWDLAAVLDSLTRVHGPDRRTWRWERDTTSWLRLAGGPGSGTRVDLPARFAPVPLPKRGHPTSPAWGSSPGWTRRSAPAAWEAFIPTASGRKVTFRRPTVPFDRFLGRFRTVPEAAALKRLEPGPGKRLITQLVPSS